MGFFQKWKHLGKKFFRKTSNNKMRKKSARVNMSNNTASGYASSDRASAKTAESTEPFPDMTNDTWTLYEERLYQEEDQNNVTAVPEPRQVRLKKSGHIQTDETKDQQPGSIDGIERDEITKKSPSEDPDSKIEFMGTHYAEDPSLQRYKESLGLGGGAKDLSDPKDKRECIILALSLDSPGREPVKIDLTTPGALQNLKKNPFKIKEGVRYSLEATFKVQHNVLDGLQYVQQIKRKGITIGKEKEMIGSYSPNTDKQPVHVKRFKAEEAPSGMMLRGNYTAISTFVDDHGVKHLEFEWAFEIAKDW